MIGTRGLRGWISLALTIGLLALVFAAGTVLAQSPDGEDPGNMTVGGSIFSTFSYQGELTNDGQPVSGNYDFQVTLWDDSTTGTQIATCNGNANIPVQDGLFTLYLSPNRPMSEVFNGTEERWIEIGVRPSGSIGAYTLLPRQPILAVPYARSLYPGAVISSSAATSGSSIVHVENTNVWGTAVSGQGASGSAVRGVSPGGMGVFGVTEEGYGIYGFDGGTENARGYGGYFQSTNGIPVYAYSDAPTEHPNIFAPAIVGKSNDGVGVWGIGDGTEAWHSVGVMGYSRYGVGGRFTSQTANIIEGSYDINGDGYSTNLRFRVTNSGNIYADGSYNCGLSTGCFNSGTGADVAERIDTPEKLRPGDVVEIDPDHPDQFRLSRTAFSALVAGVVSSNPAITLNNNDLADSESDVRTDDRPLLALVGRVPVKASAENGPIRPGDLVVAASTPGHCMRAGANPPVGTVIGKALSFLDQGTGTITILVMLR